MGSLWLDCTNGWTLCDQIVHKLLDSLHILLQTDPGICPSILVCVKHRSDHNFCLVVSSLGFSSFVFGVIAL